MFCSLQIITHLQTRVSRRLLARRHRTRTSEEEARAPRGRARRVYSLIALATEAATLGESSLTTGRLAQHSRARAAEDDGLRVRENRGDVKATLRMKGNDGWCDRSVSRCVRETRRERVCVRATHAAKHNTTKIYTRTWHLTSMKNEFGACTKRLSLCLDASSAAGGFNKSISWARTYVR